VPLDEKPRGELAAVAAFEIDGSDPLARDLHLIAVTNDHQGGMWRHQQGALDTAVGLSPRTRRKRRRRSWRGTTSEAFEMLARRLSSGVPRA
jgi:hypothetical protein